MTTIDRPNRRVFDNALLIYRDAMRPFILDALEGIPGAILEDLVCDALPSNLQWRVERIRIALAKGEPLVDQIDTGDFPALIGKYWSIAFKHKFINRDIQTHCQYVHNVRNPFDAHTPSRDIPTEETRVVLFHIKEALRLIESPDEQADVEQMLEGIGSSQSDALRSMRPELREVPRVPASRQPRANHCSERCPCWGMPTDLPRICPLCDFEFEQGWNGVDAHYKSCHQEETGIAYKDWRDSICCDHGCPGRGKR